jgi:hypothetical protein
MIIVQPTEADIMNLMYLGTIWFVRIMSLLFIIAILLYFYDVMWEDFKKVNYKERFSKAFFILGCIYSIYGIGYLIVLGLKYYWRI